MSCGHYPVPTDPERTGKSRYCSSCQQMVDHHYFSHREQKTPYLQTDNMDPLLNHADGKTYDSKSSFRSATRNAGYREVGNDSIEIKREIRGDFDIRNDLRQAIQQHLK